ncbi:MAG: hypothetical protein ACYT04_88135 [Nostoc sp.]
MIAPVFNIKVKIELTFQEMWKSNHLACCASARKISGDSGFSKAALSVQDGDKCWYLTTLAF